jgi:hypothetical protein
MVRYGANKVFSSNNTTITNNEDIDQIDTNGEESNGRTGCRNEDRHSQIDDAIKFKMDESL